MALVNLKEVEAQNRLFQTVCSYDGSIPAPYVVCREKPGYSVAFYVKRLGLTAKGTNSIYKYKKLSHDGRIVLFANRKEAIKQGDYSTGF